MATDTRDQRSNGPMDRLKDEARQLVGALGDRALNSMQGKIEGATGRLTEYVEGGAGPGLMAAVTGAKDLAEGKSPTKAYLGAGWAGLKERVRGMFGGGKGKGKGGKKLKVTNIVESIDIGAPISVVYNQWTQFADFSNFMKKVENVDQVEENKLHWKAQIFWSHREWDATILEQEPEDKIIWRSKGAKGHVDGVVTFHELAPNLTRVIVVLEYHPQGLFEHTGNLWRAQGRRARLELKHFRRHVMSEVLQHPDDVEGWRGVIHEGEVVSESDSDEEEPEPQDQLEDQEEAPAEDEEREAGETDDEEREAGDAEDTGAEVNGERRKRPARAGTAAGGRRSASTSRGRSQRSGARSGTQRATTRGRNT
jgi:hypothetical protein